MIIGMRLGIWVLRLYLLFLSLVVGMYGEGVSGYFISIHGLILLISICS